MILFWPRVQDIKSVPYIMECLKSYAIFPSKSSSKVMQNCYHIMQNVRCYYSITYMLFIIHSMTLSVVVRASHRKIWWNTYPEMVGILSGIDILIIWFSMRLCMGINIKYFSEWSIAIEFILQLGTMIFLSAYSVTCLSDRKPVVSFYFLLQIET